MPKFLFVCPSAARFSTHVVTTLALLFALASCGGGGSSAPSTTPNTTTPTTTTPTTQTPEPTSSLADRATNHSFTTNHFSGSGTCSSCHDGLTENSGKDLSIVVDWQSTMMANSARDPLWRAKVSSEIKRNPDLQEEIESTCGRCHAPMASSEASFAGIERNLFDDGFLHPDNTLFDAANDGVSCTLCHQIEDTAALGTEAGFSGQFSIADEVGTNRLLFGQYSNPLTQPMQNTVNFTPALSPHISTSEVCATCHNLTTNVVDSTGATTNQEFPEQMVYTEWQNSQFGSDQSISLNLSCQDCHMPVANGDVAISNRPASVQPRPDFSRHTFVGGNTYMLDILRNNAQQLEITATGFDRTISETRNLLRSAVSLSLQNIASVGGDLDFDIELSNNSGHKFPSGYPSRRAWIHVKVLDSAGTTVFESGAINSSGSISGMESDTSTTGFEPHYETITSGDQVQSYESIMENLDGELTYTLLEAAAYRKDNRLLPLGMDKNTVPATIRPRGASFNDPDFIAGGDRTHYQIANLPAGTYTIEASLNFQTVAYGYLQDLFLDDDNPRVALFKELDDAAQVRFEVISAATGTVDL